MDRASSVAKSWAAEGGGVRRRSARRPEEEASAGDPTNAGEVIPAPVARSDTRRDFRRGRLNPSASAHFLW